MQKSFVFFSVDFAHDKFQLVVFFQVCLAFLPWWAAAEEEKRYCFSLARKKVHFFKYYLSRACCFFHICVYIVVCYTIYFLFEPTHRWLASQRTSFEGGGEAICEAAAAAAAHLLLFSGPLYNTCECVLCHAYFYMLGLRLVVARWHGGGNVGDLM